MGSTHATSMLTTDDEATLVNFIMGLDLDVMIRLTREFAAETPDFCYRDETKGKDGFFGPDGDYKPHYVIRDILTQKLEPSCILGQVLGKMGHDYETINIMESLEDTSFAKIWRVAYALYSGESSYQLVTPKEIAWLSCVQNGQDSGLSWGEAVFEADAFYGLN